MTIRSASLIVLALVLIAGIAWADKAAKTTDKQAQKQTSSKKDTLDPAEITWHRYDEALPLAKAQGKKVFIEFTAKWCGWCKKMHATTFKDPTVVGLLNDYFVATSIDGDSRDSLNVDGFLTTERGVAREYGVRSYPIYWFLTSDGERIAPLKGYRESAAMIDVLDYLKDDTYLTVEFKDFLAQKHGGDKK
jgi:thioredoxin-related protein